MDDLLNHLVVRRPDGSLVPASSQAEPLVTGKLQPTLATARVSEKEHLTFNKSSVAPVPYLRVEPQKQSEELRREKAVSASVALAPLYSKRRKLNDLWTSGSTLANMETAQDDFTPPPSAQVHNRFPSLFDDYPNLQTVEDFEKENFFTPQRKLIQVKATKVSPVSSIRFHDQCVKLSIVPMFTYEAGVDTYASAKVECADQVIEVTGPFQSKKHAKEEVCKRALPVLEALSGNVRQDSSKKRKSSETQESRISSTVLKSENFIGLLHEYAQMRHFPPPEYSESQTATTPYNFASTVRIADGPLTPFGSETDLYPSKNNAKRAAAREAVIWLRSQGKLPAARVAKIDETPVLLPGQSGLTQLVNNVDAEAPETETLPQRIHELVMSLGFHSPNWEVRLSTPPPGEEASAEAMKGGFISMAARFSVRDIAIEPRLAGPLGQVFHVYGRKKARELCCRELLRILEEIRSGREEGY